MTDASLGVAPWLVGAGAAAALFGVLAWIGPAARSLAALAAASGWLCLALAAAAWGLRLQAAGHLPLFGTYESSLSLALACLLAAVPSALKRGLRAGLWPVAGAVSAALVAHGLSYDATIFALTISERSWVVDVHALVAWAAFGALTVNAAYALWLLLRHGEPGAGRQRALGRSLSLGFFLHTGMLVSGSFYKFLLFGTAWSFDPIETLGFVAWVGYGTLLHMHLFAAWEGRKLAKWCLGLFLILVISYRGIVYFPAWSTYHIFDMDLRMHLIGNEETAVGSDR